MFNTLPNIEIIFTESIMKHFKNSTFIAQIDYITFIFDSDQFSTNMEVFLILSSKNLFIGRNRINNWNNNL